MSAQSPAAYAPSLELRISATSANLTELGGLAEGPSGIIAATQPADHVIRVFGADGRLVGTFGRLGEGPADFKYPHQVRWVRDSLFILDTDQRRLTVLSATGKMIRDQRFPAFTSVHPDRADFAPALESGWVVASFPNGDFVFNAVRRPLQTAKWSDAMKAAGSVYVRADSRGFVRSVLAVVPNRANCFHLVNGRRVGSVFECAFPRIDVAADGSRLAIVVAATSGPDVGTYRLTVIGGNGDTLFARKYPFVQDRITPAIADSIRSARASSAQSADARALIAGIPVSPMYPPVEAVVVGTDSTIWIGLRASKGNRSWTIIGPSGGIIGSLTLPAAVDIKSANLRAVLAGEKDEDDLESIVRYRLRRIP